VCGPEETRTPDFYSAIVALSQLSYRPVVLIEYNIWAGRASRRRKTKDERRKTKDERRKTKDEGS
jgi:hypothetical protein